MLTKRDALEMEVMELTAAEEREILDREARRLFNMSAEQFARKWHSGEFRDDEDPRVTQVAMLLPDAW